MEQVTLRKWNEKEGITPNMEIITKMTDMGAPMSNKSILGFYINVNQKILNTPSNPSFYHLKFFYRSKDEGSWEYLGVFYSLARLGLGGQYREKILSTPIKHIKHVQLRIEGFVTGEFSINDFGLLYRTYRDIGTETHDEN